MKKLFILSQLVFWAVSGFSQHNTANIWYFGDHAGIDFNTGVPVALTDGQLNTAEGCAVICNSSGDLLFYTEGTTVWNKNHVVMQNGTGLLGHFSATQSSIIVPYPQSDSLYIIFTIDARENSLLNGIRYSVVNMNPDNGLGAVTSVKNILLHTPVSEKLTMVINPDQVDYWVIAHEWGSDAFLAYSVTSAGVDTVPVVSNVGGIHSGGNPSYLHSIGCMKASLSGNLLAVANYRNSGYFELFDFSGATGIVSNVRTSPATYFRPYGVEFSPDENFLYGSICGSEYTDGKLYQFDLSAPNPLDNSILVGSSLKHIMALQLAPNGKIFVSCRDQEYISCIEQPDTHGIACSFIHDAFYLNGGITRIGLPLLYFSKDFIFFTGSVTDTAICQGDSIFLQQDYQTDSGTYYDVLHSSLGWDSIITTNLSVLPVPGIPYVSENQGVLSTAVADEYQWYLNGSPIPGAGSQSYTPFLSGYYQVEIFNAYDCSSYSDTYYFEYMSVTENAVPGIDIFPNPFTNVISVSNDGAFTCEVTGMCGRVVSEEAACNNQTSLYLAGLSSGMYILKIRSENKIFFKRIVKE